MRKETDHELHLRGTLTKASHPERFERPHRDAKPQLFMQPAILAAALITDSTASLCALSALGIRPGQLARAWLRAHEPELLQRWLKNGHYGTRPAIWWHAQRINSAVVRLPCESQLDCLHRLNRLTASELNMVLLKKKFPAAARDTNFDGTHLYP